HVKNYITPEQHGFMKGRSTMTNLCEFTNFVSEALDKRRQIDVVHTDLTKAFDRVHHCILLRKLCTFGLCDSFILLIQSIITKRHQYFEFRGYRSSIFSVNSGVAQGSNLGPLLFILFFNDVVSKINCKTLI